LMKRQHQVGIRLPLWKRVKGYADYEQLSVTEVVEDALADYLEARSIVEDVEDEDEKED